MPPTGLVDAWNRAVAAATGDFVIMLHQNDLLDPEYLAQVEQALTTLPCVRHVFAACRYIDAEGRVLGQPPEPHVFAPVLYSCQEYTRAGVRHF